MSASDVLVRCSALSGTWEALGSGNARGIVVQDLNMESDLWGPRAAQFVLRRDPKAIWPDVSAFTPIEVEVGGIVVWEGRVKETPTKDGADRLMTVMCEGWQYHLDDDVYQKMYVETDLTKFVDQRSLAGSNLLNARAAGTVQVGAGMITVGLPLMTVLTSNYAGVTLDFGASAALAKRFVATFYKSPGTCNDGSTSIYAVRGHDIEDCVPAGDGVEGVLALGTLTDGAHTFRGTFNTARRYVTIFVYYNGGGGTYGVDQIVKVTSCLIASSTAYESGDASILKASDVVIDAVSLATLLLSSDTSKIQATTFSIPQFAMSAPATPREVINAVNAYHAWQYRITRNKVPEYRPLPSTAMFSADESAGIEFDDTSSNSGLDIYSSVKVQYTAPDGTPGSVSRSQPGGLFALSAIQPTNPGAEVDTSTWAGNSSTLTRTTTAGEFTAGVAGFKMSVAGSNGSAQSSSWTGGSFIPGQSYRLTLDVKSTASGSFESITVQVLVDGSVVASTTAPNNVTFNSVTLDWAQPSTSNPTVIVTRVSTFFSGLVAFFDNIVLQESSATLVNRRKFRRTKILSTNMALNQPAAQQIGDTYLTGHKTTPFKGSILVNGSSAIQLAQGGVTVPPWHLLYNTGELVRLPHLIDPDSGGVGREGRIAVVRCNPITGVASIDLDNQRSNFEALLARLSVVTGSIAPPV